MVPAVLHLDVVRSTIPPFAKPMREGGGNAEFLLSVAWRGNAAPV
jgi:hypothetical protein